VQLALQAPPNSPGVGDTFQVVVRLSAGSQQVDGVEFHLNFEPSVLQVVDSAGAPSGLITPGSALDVGLLNRVDTVAGHIDFAAGKLTPPFPSGDLTVATIRFKALAATTAAGTPLTYVDAGARRSAVTFGGSAATVQLISTTIVIRPVGG